MVPRGGRGGRSAHRAGGAPGMTAARGLVTSASTRVRESRFIRSSAYHVAVEDELFRERTVCLGGAARIRQS
jgi:hypothetical protein